MINRLEKLIGNRGEISHHIISSDYKRFYVTFNDDLNSNESFWTIKIRNEFSPRKSFIVFYNTTRALIHIENSIKIDREEKLNKLKQCL